MYQIKQGQYILDATLWTVLAIVSVLVGTVALVVKSAYGILASVRSKIQLVGMFEENGRTALVLALFLGAALLVLVQQGVTHAFDRVDVVSR